MSTLASAPISGSSPFSSSSPSLDRLSSADRQRLTEVLDRYLTGLERGLPPPRETLLAQHPDLAEMLTAYFGSLDELHDMAAGFAGQSTETLGSAVPGDAAGRMGDFELVREIGRGGMGVVYEARQISLGRRVALKVLPFAAVVNARQIARFKHEAQAAAQLHHPGIVPVFAVGVEDGIHYFAMQLIDGQSLDRALAEVREQRLRSRVAAACSEAETSCYLARVAANRDYYSAVARLGVQAAEALDAAHEAGVVHRDIKPSNLIVDAAGRLWVTDFGLARVARDAALTRTGDLVGTMRYMSPEQAAGRSILVDHRTDIYSLGATLYELLCLRPAYPEESGTALLRQIEARDPIQPRQIRRDIPADLEAVVLKAMARERDQRYATARHMADDLQAVVDGKPTRARLPNVFDRCARWERRHRRAVSASAALLLVAVAGLALSTFLITRENDRAEQNAARAQQHAREARAVLDALGIDLSQRLAEVPGAEEIRHALLNQTAAYYHDFVRTSANDPASGLDIALAQARIATLLDEVGQGGEAVAAHAKAVQAFADLVAAQPRRLDLHRQLALSRNNYGLALTRTGQWEKARQEFTAAIGWQQDEHQKRPHHQSGVTDLVASLSNLGKLQHELGEIAQARESYQTAIELLQTGLVEAPNDALHNRKLAALYNNLAVMHLTTDAAAAIGFGERAFELQQAAAQSPPDDLTSHRERALTLNNLGSAYARMGKLPQARDAYEKALEVHAALLAREPANRTYQRDLAVTGNNLGLIYSRSGELDKAEAALSHALQLHQSLFQQLPEDAATRSSLASVHSNLGVVLRTTGQMDLAAKQFEQAIEQQSAALELSQQRQQYRELLRAHYRQYARTLRDLGRHEDAIDAILARRALGVTDGDELFHVAEDLARTHRQSDESASALRERCRRLVAETLAQSVAAGHRLPIDLAQREPFNDLNLTDLN